MPKKRGSAGARRAPAGGAFARVLHRLVSAPVFAGKDQRGGPSHLGIELAVAVIFMLFGVIVMADSVRVGMGWSPEGPRAGYFPFYVGLFVTVNSLVVLVLALIRREQFKSRVFSNWDELRRVAEVLVPSVIYVGAIYVLGIYVATALFIAWFMWRIGRYKTGKIVPTALGVPAVAFAMFEWWFKMPLPKGPLERLFGM